MGVEDKGDNIFKNAQQGTIPGLEDTSVTAVPFHTEEQTDIHDSEDLPQMNQVEEPSPLLKLGNVISFKTISDRQDPELSPEIEIELLEKLYTEISHRARNNGRNSVSKDYFDQTSGIKQTRTIINGEKIITIKYPFTFNDTTGVKYVRHLLYSGKILWEATKTYLPNDPGSYVISFSAIPEDRK